MQVRHNTSLLEEAVAHVVRQAAIPTLEAEAAAALKRGRAQAILRLGTGAAIAIAAIGLGVGIYLAQHHVPEPNVDPGSATARLSEFAIPFPERVAEAELQSPQSSVTQDEDANTPASEVQPEPVITTDYSKFNTVAATMFEREWTIKAGHHFDTENDPSWSSAWCYADQLVEGVTVTVSLADRSGHLVHDAP